MRLLAVGTLQSAVDALLALGRAVVASVVRERVVSGADGADNLVPAPGSRVTKLLAVGALGGGGAGVELLYPSADAKDKQLSLDGSVSIFFRLKGNAGTASPLGLSLLLAGQPVGCAYWVEAFVESGDLFWKQVEINACGKAMDSYFVPRLAGDGLGEGGNRLPSGFLL